jgi:hypothetical protein
MTNSKQIDHLERRKAIAEATAEVKKTDAIVQLAYFKYIRDMLENEGTGDATRKSYDEMMNFYNDRIEDLEMDASGQKRYNYILKMTEDNGDKDDASVKVFKTAQQVHEYIVEMTQRSDIQDLYLYGEGDEYHVPYADEIDEMVNKIRYSVEFELCKFGDEDVCCLTFTLKHIVVN